MKTKHVTAVLLTLSLIFLSPAIHAQAFPSSQNFKKENKSFSRNQTLKKLVESLRNSKVEYDQGSVNIYPDIDPYTPVILTALIFALCLYSLECAYKEEGLSQHYAIEITTSLALLSLLCLYKTIKNIVVGSKPAVTMDSRGISYQECGLFWDSYSDFLSWHRVSKIGTEAKLFSKKSFLGPNFYKIFFVVLKGKSDSDSIFIPESKLPISFEDFYDLVVSHFWDSKEKK